MGQHVCEEISYLINLVSFGFFERTSKFTGLVASSSLSEAFLNHLSFSLIIYYFAFSDLIAFIQSSASFNRNSIILLRMT